MMKKTAIILGSLVWLAAACAAALAGPTGHTAFYVNVTNTSGCPLKAEVWHDGRMTQAREFASSQEPAPQALKIESVAYLDKKRYYTYQVKFFSPAQAGQGDDVLIVNHTYTIRNEWRIPVGPVVLECKQDLDCPGCQESLCAAADAGETQLDGDQCFVDYTF